MTSFNPYQSIETELISLGADLFVSELHGLLIGYLCAVRNSTSIQRAALYDEWVGQSAPQALLKLLELQYAQALESLDEYSDFEFRLLIPDADETIAERAASVGLWCGGFLSGFGETGRFSTKSLFGETLSNVREALEDLGKIAGLKETVPEGEDNEADLFEIEEFVRVAVLLIFAETGSISRH